MDRVLFSVTSESTAHFGITVKPALESGRFFVSFGDMLVFLDLKQLEKLQARIGSALAAHAQLVSGSNCAETRVSPVPVEGDPRSDATGFAA